MKSSRVVVSLRALAHASRLSAFRALVQAGPGGMSVGELRERLDIAPATLTAHLNVLRRAGLVLDQREGRVIRLRADYPSIDALIGYLTENCCGGVPCAPVGNKPSAAKTAVSITRAKARPRSVSLNAEKTRRNQ